MYILYIFKSNNTKDADMGFLSGTFMRSFALRMKLQAQRRQMSVTMRLSQAKRQMQNKEKALRNQKEYQTYSVTSPLSQQIQTESLQMQGLIGKTDDISRARYTELQNSIFQKQQYMNDAKAYYANFWEIQMEKELEPLRNTEERLEVEKTQADQDFEFWAQTEKAYADQAKNDMKSLIPESQA